MKNKWTKLLIFTIISISIWSFIFISGMKYLHAEWTIFAKIFLFINPLSLTIITTAIIFALQDIGTISNKD